MLLPTDPGVVDVSASWTAHLPPVLLDLLEQGQKDAFIAAMAKAQASASPDAARTLALRGKPYGQADPFDRVRRRSSGSPRRRARTSTASPPDAS